MELKDILSMEVPRTALRTVTTANKLKPGGSSVEDYANIIVSTDKTKPVGLLLAEQYQYAGRTAVNWFKPILGVDKTWNNIQKFKTFLVQKFGQTVMEEGLRQGLDREPRLYRVDEIGGSLIISFTYLGPERRTLENYQIVKRPPQLLDYVLIHFSPLAFETRVRADESKKFLDSMLKAMNIDPEKSEWDKVSKLSENEAYELATRLNAGLVGAKAKMTEGIYATKEVTANLKVKDLRQEEEFKKEFSGKPLKKQKLTFSYGHRFGLTEDINFVITEEGLNFLTPVTEDIISIIRNFVFDIKNIANKTADNLSRGTGI